MKTIKVGETVKIFDVGEGYHDYKAMLKHMIKKFKLNEEEIMNGFNAEDLCYGLIGKVVAIEKHEWSDDTLVLVNINEDSYNLIGIKGLKIKEGEFWKVPKLEIK